MEASTIILIILIIIIIFFFSTMSISVESGNIVRGEYILNAPASGPASVSSTVGTSKSLLDTQSLVSLGAIQNKFYYNNSQLIPNS